MVIKINVAKEEIALKEFVIKVLKIIKILKNNIKVFLLIVIIGSPIGYFMPENREYTAKTSILLNSGGTSKGFMNLASTLGFGASTEMVSFEKFEMIASSNKLKNLILEDSIQIEGNKDIFARHLIKYLGLNKKWEKSHPNLLTADLSKSSIDKDSIFWILQLKLKPLFDISEGKGELVEITARHSNEELAQKLSLKVASEGIKFFLDRSISKDIRTKNILQNRIDSVQVAIAIAETNYSNIKDKSHRSVKTQIQINLLTSQRQLALLNELYIQLVKQFEMIDFKINNADSGLEIIDTPSKPLSFTSKSLKMRLILSSFISAIIAITLILGIYYGRKTIRNLKELKITP